MGCVIRMSFKAGFHLLLYVILCRWTIAAILNGPVLTGSGLLNRPSTIQRVADIPEQHPYTSDDNLWKRIPSFTYKISSDGARPLQSTDLPTCGSVMYPSTLSYVLNYPGYLNDLYPNCGDLCFALRPVFHTLPIMPDSASVLETRFMSICNPFQDTDCKVCVRNNAGVQAHITVLRDNSAVLMYVQCALFEIIDCGVTRCSNGNYATSYLQKDSHGFVISHTQCLPCKPGTWLTCRDDANCAYDVPTSPGDFDGGQQIYQPPGQDPVGGCFACESAGNKMHYGLTNRKVGIDIGNSNPLGWYCPGGAEPPELCKAPFIGSNTNHTACTCKPGQYLIGGLNPCQTCPAGYYCIDGELRECLDDYHQSKTGGSECSACLLETGEPIPCPGSGMKLQKCRGRQKSEPLKCVPCNSCRHDYEFESAGLTDCY